MATYFHGSPEIQPDGLQTLYLMNPGYVGYADASAPVNMVVLNPAMSSVNSMNFALAGQPNLQQHFVGIPLQPATAAAPPQDSTRPPAIHAAHEMPAAIHHGLPPPHIHYNLWTSPSGNSVDDVAMQFSHRRPSGVTPPQQTLSLSLSRHEMPGPAQEIAPASTDEVKMIVASSSSASGGSNGVTGLQSLLMRSKYLKAAQQLLDELVSVGKEIITEATKKTNKDSEGTKSCAAAEEETSTKRGGADLTTAERQELQMKKGKLANMLDEVEHRYRQYHHQMQIVVSSFEAVAGYGSARTYTALALKTISKQFRCLRDAITGQIRATSKSLGEEADPKSGSSRLRFVDHHLRQQRALQQLGMIQHNAWRPQRGLPERSVSILRAWLFEHFLHPYPKDSDKHMLAKQTGLTRSQVSNWFINARVRLWKPMVEEMYMEEIKDQEQNTDENASKSDANGSSTSKSTHQESSPTTAAPVDSLKRDVKQPFSINAVHPSSSSLETGQNQCSYYDNEAILLPSLKKSRVDEPRPIDSVDLKQDEASNQEFLLKFMDGRHRAGDQGYPLIPGSTSHDDHYGSYSIGELGRFDAEQFAPSFSGNGISLTLGLQHFENHLSLSGGQPSFLSSQDLPMGRRLDMSSEASEYCSLNNNATVAHSSNGYESMSIQNRKRFAAQLLSDFVA